MPRAAPTSAIRHLGRFQLLRLLGKSARTMLWLVDDPQVDRERVLVLPRGRPPEAQSLQHWLAAAHKASRIDHPGLLPVVEVGEYDRWPYIAYDRGSAVTLAERLGGQGLASTELVPWALQVLAGLAFAHEAGIAHHDLQTGMLVLAEGGDCRLMGLGVALPPPAVGSGLQAQHQAAERDVLALGLVLHHALAGAPALDQSDVGSVIARLAPLGRDTVRLPWTGMHSIPEALRAIVNRATDCQARQRYRSARTLERALGGWLKTEGESGEGPIALLLDRMRAAGLLPAMPGGASRAVRMAAMERERTIELAEVALQDVGLAFELLRRVNGPRSRGALGAGSGTILTLRRAIALVGLDGVRHAAQALRPWPGPLGEAHADDLARLVNRVRLAGRVAQWLRPAGYDAEVVYLLALMQNLGRLALQYHFPEEAAQIRRLMLPAADGEPEGPGMSEHSASFAVLGVAVDALGQAVARHWGLDDAVLQMIRRLPLTAPVHAADNDDDMLRLSASCANEVVDSQGLPTHQRAAFLLRVVQRYGPVLGISLREVQLAAQGLAPDKVASVDGAAPACGPDLAAPTPAPAAPQTAGQACSA